MIPADLKQQGVMLCSASKDVHYDVDLAVRMLDEGGKHVFDMKYDGIRSLAFVDEGVVTLINRRGVDITFRYPEVVAALANAYPSGSIALDGEIVVFDAEGNADFAASHRRDAQQNVRSVAPLVAQFPATLMAFDLLHFHGDDLRRMPYKARHAILSTQAKTAFGNAGSALAWSTPRTDGLAYWQEVKSKGLEGLVAKSLTAPYRAGRSANWVKLKVCHQISVIATGYTEGKGSRKGKIGAIEMTMIGPDSQPVRVGEVGTGFTQKTLAELQALMDAGTLLVIEVEITAITKEGKCRFPSYKGVRTDKSVLECTTDQLQGIPII